MRYATRGFSTGVFITLLLFVVAAGGVAWVYTGMVTQQRWPIRWLEVDGPFERVSAERVRSGLAPLVHGSFFTVDTSMMRKVAEKIPWVSAVVVQKSWPDTIDVTIHEYVPAAHWTNGSLVTKDGEKFTVPAVDEIQGLPWLAGPESQRGLVFTTWQKLDDKLMLIGQQIDHLSLDARGSWSARLNGGTRVKFGKGNIFRNLDTLVSTWAGLMHGQAIPPISIDLRYTNGFAVLWPQNMDAIAGNYGEKGR